jgi:microcystin-dependent protein
MDLIKLHADGFPLTIERLQFLQNTYAKAFSQLSKIYGEGAIIIDGLERDGDTISSGAVIIRGEIMAFEGGAYESRIGIFETVENVPYNIDANADGQLDPKAADTVRFAKCSIWGGVYGASTIDFKRVGNLQSLGAQLGDIKLVYRAFDPSSIDKGWALCDGENGTPDMRNNYPIGAGDDVSLGQTVGSKSVTLGLDNIPAHNHNGNATIAGHKHDLPKTVYSKEGGFGDGNTFSDKDNLGKTDVTETSMSPSQNVSVSTATKGGGKSHENRPPSVGLNYLMFKGF